MVASNSQMALPFALNASGGIAMTSDPNAIARQHLVSYILTTPGERVMRPNWGTQVMSFLFEGLDVLSAEILRSEIANAVQRDVPEVVLKGFVARGSGGTDEILDDGELHLAVTYAQNLGGGSTVGQQTTTISAGAA